MDRAEDSRAQELREKFGPFRVLVVGKANSGKTTVLQAVCGTKESPQVIRAGAKPLGHFRHLQDLLKDKRSVITPSTDRGKHSIEDELHFPSNPGFIFHDSPGFESGDTKELDLVRQFITERAKEKSIKKQLHVIWYCLPTDNDARLLSASERNFFQEYDTGHVPIIMIFTKFDSLDARAFQIFRSEGMSSSDAHARAIARANKDFDEIRLPNVRQLKYPPAGEVRMRNMHKEKDGGIRNQRSVDELLSKTASALRNDVLQVMLASVQRNNLELCMESAVKRQVVHGLTHEAGKTDVRASHSGPIMKTAEDQTTPEDGSAVLLPEGQLKDFLQALFVWFPYINEVSIWSCSKDSQLNQCAYSLRYSRITVYPLIIVPQEDVRTPDIFGLNYPTF
ncbi:hypothetical protein BOTBODRAFT_172345 [Botryobasidium botryosum FD-172 SS1]|uniref:Uncharacterized protein n=1 Tax=Botryobasidium botryosum (strain FD-172 SS1) TaxID=930990 RepID=A0A067MZI5_BOTB1|nr:hypothetical protein BOTBODRAFT_172345 [Botryobasidium botryosum FD-172 SS1]